MVLIFQASLNLNLQMGESLKTYLCLWQVKCKYVNDAHEVVELEVQKLRLHVLFIVELSPVNIR